MAKRAKKAPEITTDYQVRLTAIAARPGRLSYEQAEAERTRIREGLLSEAFAGELAALLDKWAGSTARLRLDEVDLTAETKDRIDDDLIEHQETVVLSAFRSRLVREYCYNRRLERLAVIWESPQGKRRTVIEGVSAEEYDAWYRDEDPWERFLALDHTHERQAWWPEGYGAWWWTRKHEAHTEQIEKETAAT